MGLLPIGPDPESGLWEFAHLASGEPATRGKNGLELTPRTGLVLVLLPGGTFWMGAQSVDSLGHNYDPHVGREEEDIEWLVGPVHEVHVAPFFVSKYEMTRAQWWHATHANPGRTARSAVHPSDLPKPVGMVSWNECEVVTRRLGLALPHEEQWEYAARAGTETPWSTGLTEDTLQGHANLYDQTGWKESPSWKRVACEPSIIDDGFLKMTPVGHYQPNGFGLHDMHGNVAEWCANPPYQYRSDLDVQRAEGPSQNDRSVRGGSARTAAGPARSAYHDDCDPSTRMPALGLRPIRELDRRE